MTVAKLTTPGLLKIKVFWNKGYGVVIYYVTHIILQVWSYEEGLAILTFHNFNFIRQWSEKPIFVKSGLGWIIFGSSISMALKFYNSLERKLKLKVK